MYTTTHMPNDGISNQLNLFYSIFVLYCIFSYIIVVKV